MRTTIFKFLFAITALAVVSCDEWNVEIDTQIMRDGSCVRTVKSDNNGCLTEDDGWTVVETKDSVRNFSNDKIQASVISRRFDRVEDMNGYPALQIYGKPVKSESSLVKSFKWFYTDYTFTETFPGWQESFDIPITDYVSPDEASFWFTGYPELPQGITGEELTYISDISWRIDHWYFDVMWDLYFKSIASFYDEIENPPVDRETFLSMRDSVMNTAFNEDWEFWGEEGENDPLKYLDGFFHTKVFSETKCPEAESYGEKLWYQSIGLDELNASYALKMPGKITDAGRGIVENDMIRYRFGGAYLIPGDYTIAASSRCVNVWAFLLSGLILIIAVGSFFIKR